ncbi:hypothetical protein ACRQ5D_34310 [Mucilaginibacter sp. P25]|uniref:hypothetical protein n=1 Tax=Mucilaginibacter sp. P25 TaxID=3423945 RepID=UPI003D79727A
MKKITIQSTFKLLIGLALLAALLPKNAAAQTLSNLNSLKGRINSTDLEVSTADAPTFLGSFTRAAPAPPAPGGPPVPTRAATEIAKWQAASRYARDNKDDFAKLLSANKAYPDLVQFNGNAGQPTSHIAVAYAILASQSSANIATYLNNNNIAAPADVTAIQQEISALKRAISQITSPSLAIFATGDVRGVAAGTTDPTAATGTGTIGFTYASPKTIYTIKIAVASTQDTIKSGYGAFLLSPSNGSPLKSGLFEVFRKLDWDDQSWLHFYVTGATSTWQIAQDATTKVVTAKSASTVGAALLYRRQIINGTIGNTGVEGGYELGISGRWIEGDVRNLLQTEDGTKQYLNVFPSKRDHFLGFEGGFSLSFGQITAGLQAYYLFPKSGESVDGLSGLQITAGISIRADLINDIFHSK